MDKDKADILKRIEELTNQLNSLFNQKGKSVFSRYPLTFALAVIFGFSMMSEGIKGIINYSSFLKENPLIMLFIGLLILVLTGTLYKKLSK
ncbi:MAG: hypothetical protein WAV11_03505 [Minisyncoccia bacterium]